MYTYQTFPGQTFVRASTEGFTARELIAELDVNGNGIIVLADDTNPNEFLVALEGSVCGNLHQGNWEPYFRQMPANGYPIY